MEYTVEKTRRRQVPSMGRLSLYSVEWVHAATSVDKRRSACVGMLLHLLGEHFMQGHILSLIHIYSTVRFTCEAYFCIFSACGVADKSQMQKSVCSSILIITSRLSALFSKPAWLTHPTAWPVSYTHLSSAERTLTGHSTKGSCAA